MPLVRLEVRNEYGLGQPELYKETNRDDPKAVLDGVAVAGLVGILRQLGDLAEYDFSINFTLFYLCFKLHYSLFSISLLDCLLCENRDLSASFSNLHVFAPL